MKYSTYNVVIIGSGLAGLYLANKLSCENCFKDGIALITKGEVFSGSTSLAQGGIVSVIPEINKSDSVESHIKDTMNSGCGLNNINAVEFVSRASSVVTQELIAMGVEFDKNEKNTLNFTLEGAHSVPRILHSQGDSTGKIIEKTLCDNILKKDNINIYTNTMALELLVDGSNSLRGVIVYNESDNSLESIYSNEIVIATGGIGQLYNKTTNPIESTADGIALAIRAGAEVENMEFVQFHPTGLYCACSNSTPLISESVRGEGAKLVNIKGEYFAKKYHKDADLAPRDVVARAIFNEMKLTGENYVNLDISQIGIEKFKQRFPTITKLCEENNIDLSSGLIPVAPVQHYFMGGIKTSLNAKTSINNLYAIGECAMTGLHGANRLASNSLLECAVFAQKLSEELVNNFKNPPKKFDSKVQSVIEKYSSLNLGFDDNDSINKIFSSLKNIMSDNVGIIRNNESLNNAMIAVCALENALNNLSDVYSKRKFELVNALCVSKKIIFSALNRENSIGAHYRDDTINNVSEVYKENATNEKLLAR